MAQRQKKPSFDAMIKFFMQKYDIATKKDINRLERKIDELKKSLSKKPAGKRSVSKITKGKSAAEVVLNVIKDIGDGASFADIKARTDYDDKKLRNIVFRLNKEGKIKRKKRGIYVAV
ncbi:MAG: hypothetical protein K9K82_08270 [Desulfobacteraceae bacterium]|nr:hypothetical protein [Desulfobacteraceae bacterium]